MTSFWLAIVVLTCLSLVFILRPIIKYHSTRTNKGLSADWFIERQSELENEFKLGKYNMESYQAALTELKLTAKDELTRQEREVETRSTYAKLPLIFGALVLVMTLIFYLNAGQHKKLADWQQTLEQLPDLSNQIINNNSQQVSSKELIQFALGLRTKLAKKEDYFGWMILGNVLFSMQDTAGALAAFDKSYKMKPDNVSTLVSYAQALQKSGEDYEIQKSIQLLQQALSMQPQHELGQILLAEGFLMSEQYELSKQVFQLIDQWLSVSDPRKEAVQQRLDYIDNKLTTTKTTIKLTVEIVDDISLSSFNYLFVFAKVEQMPMPVAVKKIPLSANVQLPMAVELSDEDIMMEQFKLSNFEQVNVFARLSKDDSAEFSSGEWQGKALKVNTKESSAPLTIVINEESK